MNQIVNETCDPHESIRIPWLNTLLYKLRRLVKPGSSLERALAGTQVKKYLRKLLLWNRRARDAQKQDVLIPAENQEDHVFMTDAYPPDIEDLENLLARDVSFWT